MTCNHIQSSLVKNQCTALNGRRYSRLNNSRFAPIQVSHIVAENIWWPSKCLALGWPLPPKNASLLTRTQCQPSLKHQPVFHSSLDKRGGHTEPVAVRTKNNQPARPLNINRKNISQQKRSISCENMFTHRWATENVILIQFLGGRWTPWMLKQRSNVYQIIILFF